MKKVLKSHISNLKKITQIGLAVLFTSALVTFSTSCQQETLSFPSFDTRRQPYTGKISAPADVKATNGGYREITLTWTASSNARQYFIYASDSDIGEFTKFAETSDEKPVYTDKTDSDKKRYYKITAVDTYGKESEQSRLCYGTTLAQPVITNIEQDKSGKSVTVHWYGGDNRSAYVEQLLYTVIMYDSDQTNVLQEITLDGTENSCTVTDLDADRQYYFQVNACLKSQSDDGHTEKSAIMDARTAHRLIPNPPAEFSATQGISKENIVLTWKLPSLVDLKSGGDFVQHPVYFKIFRKEKDADDDTYQVLSSYIGIIKGNSLYKNTETLGSGEYRIDCSAESNNVTPEDSLLTLTKAAEPDSDVSVNYPTYIPGTTLTFVDKTGHIGKQYTYKVQSYTDDNGKNVVTSDESYAEYDGWKITNPSLKAIPSVQLDSEDENIITKVNVEFEASFEDFGLNSSDKDFKAYQYALYETKITMKDNNGEGDDEQTGEETKRLACSNSISDIQTYKVSYDTAENEYYYYKYTLKIHSATDYDYSQEEYAKAEAPGSVIVVRKADKKPVIDSFTVEDGYTEYFKLSWSYNEKYSYSLKWNNTDKDGTTSESTVDISASELTLSADKSTAVYMHPANSGDIRTYTLIANNGMKEEKTLNEAKTLATPELVSADLQYDSITVSWTPVQKSNGTYTVKAYYEDDPDTEVAVAEKTSISTAESRISCTIAKPEGYNNALVSGKKIIFTVTTQSDTFTEEEKDLKTSASNIEVCTLGPALTDTQVNSTAIPDGITVTWKEVEGAAGYKIYRTKYELYNDGEEESWKPNSVDVYYKEADTLGSISVTENDGTVDSNNTKCNVSSGVYTLYDRYTDSNYDITNRYSLNQSQISWGIPYSYVVIPVKTSDDFTGDLSAETNKLGISLGEEFTYSGTDELAQNAIGAATGYGLNLKASKADYLDKVTLKWDTSFGSGTPIPYYRVSGSTDAKWEKVTFDKYLYDSEKNTITIAVSSTDDDRCTPYEYLVAYREISTAKPVHNSFENKIKEQKDSNKELNCKGYAFTLPGISAKKGSEKYSEEVSWNKYDTEERAAGPEYYEIFIYNDDLEDGWVKLFTLDGTSANVTSTDVDAAAKDVALTPNGTQFKIKPAGFKSGAETTEGLLKVLRSYKHYYKIEAVRQNSNGEEIRAKYGDDKSVYAYREITIDEFIDISALSIGECLYNDNYSTVKSVGTWSNDHTFTFKDDSPTFYKVSGELQSSGNATGEKPIAYGARRSNGALSSDKSTPCTLTLSPKDDALVDIYYGEVTIDTMKSSSGKYTVDFGGSTKTLEGSEVSRASQYFVFK